MISAPIGMSASFASLKCCKPNGIPIMVIQNNNPNVKCSIASTAPENNIQRIFTIREPTPPRYSTSFPNGKKDSVANLKHCTPIGIPIMVMHQSIPATHHDRPDINPPNKNQIMFPKQLIILLLYN